MATERIEIIYDLLRNAQDFSAQFHNRGRNDTHVFIEFYAFDDQQPQYLLKVWFNIKGKYFTISSHVNGHQKQRCKFDFAENESNSVILEGIKNRLKTARNEFVNEIDAGNACPNNVKAGKNAKQKPTKQQNKPKNEIEAEFIEAIQKAMARTDETAPKDQFWKTDVNPWFKQPTYQASDTFILKSDYDNTSINIKKYIRKEGEDGGEYDIRANVLPQPYIGDPETAPVWLLLMNPSYSEADVYDMVQCDEKTKKAVLRSITCEDKKTKEKKQRYSDKEITRMLPDFFTKDSDCPGSLEARKDLMRDQLKFDFSEIPSRFYVLDKVFHTVKARSENQARRDRTHQGSYEWWGDYLLKQNICGGNDENLKKFFVLESFPYHSKKFDPKNQDFLDDVVSKVLHFPFWVKMVRYALENKKVLLCRGKMIASMVSAIAKICGLPTDRIFVKTKGTPDFKVSYGSFAPYAAVSAGTVSPKDINNADKIIREAMGQR